MCVCVCVCLLSYEYLCVAVVIEVNVAHFKPGINTSHASDGPATRSPRRCHKQRMRICIACLKLDVLMLLFFTFLLSFEYCTDDLS